MLQTVQEFDYEHSYNLYLIMEEFEERYSSLVFNSILNESAQYITEGEAINAIKEFIEKIINAIKEAFRKFSEAVKDKFSKKEDYLKKYKIIITTKQALKANISNFYEYNIDKLKSAKLPKMNMEKLLGYADESAFIKEEFKDYVPAEGEKFQDKVKSVFRGGSDPKTVSSSNIDLKKLFEYCNTYNKLVSIMEKDIATIDEAGVLVKAKFKLNSSSGASVVKKEKVKESFGYNETIDYYFNEADDDKPAGGTPTIDQKDNSNTASNGSTSNTSTNANNKNNNAPKKEVPVQNDTSDKDEEKKLADEKKAEEQKEAEQKEKEKKATKIYFKVCADFLSMRFAIASEIYKSYMKIIEWHVNQYVKDNNGDRSGKVKKEKKSKNKNGETPEENQSGEGENTEPETDGAGNKILKNGKHVNGQSITIYYYDRSKNKIMSRKLTGTDEQSKWLAAERDKSDYKINGYKCYGKMSDLENAEGIQAKQIKADAKSQKMENDSKKNFKDDPESRWSENGIYMGPFYFKGDETGDWKRLFAKDEESAGKMRNGQYKDGYTLMNKIPKNKKVTKPEENDGKKKKKKK